MTFNQDEIRKIVSRVAEEALKRLAQNNQVQKKTLAVMPGYVFDAEAVVGYLKERQADAVLFEGAYLPADDLKKIQIIRTMDDRRNLASNLTNYDEIVMVMPSLALIRTLARGDDTVFEAMLALRPLLWGRQVTLLLDFEAPKYRRSTMFAELADSLDVLEKTGMCIVTIAQAHSKPDEAKDLVTEQDVKDACKNESRRVRIKEGSIVTQLAQDTAREMGVSIEY